MNGQDRRAWLDGVDAQINEALRYYLGPTGLAPKVNALAAGAGMVMDGTDFVDAYGASGNMMRNPSAMNALAMVPPVMALAMPGISNRLLQGAGEMAGDAARFVTAEDGGVKLFHGSPHDFDKFSMDKIGTGEGAQAYGHGLYFAENEGVARGYRDTLSQGAVRYEGQPGIRRGSSPDDVTISAVTRYITQGNDPEMAMRRAANDFAYSARKARVEGNAKWAQEYEELEAKARALDLSKFDESPGRMYEVNVDASPEDFLDYDAPWAEQPENVRKHFDYLTRGPSGYKPDGAELAGRMEGNLWIREAADAGIPGIKYLDAGSRGAGDGSRNYVVFDENLISIVRKYGIAGAAGLLGATVADVEQAMAGGNSQGNALRDYVVGRDGPAMPPRADR
jgi:hypothetical protein